MKNKKATKNSTKTETENVVVGNWVAPVSARRDVIHSGFKRKVKTNGVVTFDMTSMLNRVMSAMRNGKEVRFQLDGEDAIRFYPCLDKSLTEMFIASQTMGDFRQSLQDIGFKVVRQDGQEVSELRQATKEMEADRAQRPNVTPDSVVVCPNCGTEFRVGKQLV